ncbi:MAG: alpha/beta hydrolase [Myxococcales bacterium]|nr:alpha/beta hydrolase [Myxococcales bacterium]
MLSPMHVRGIDLGVRDSGEGEPFVWGHGLLGSMEQEDEAGALAWPSFGSSLRLIRYDARGHGSSEATLAPAAYRWPELAGDLLALLDAIQLERAVLGGVSMGCATALHAAVQAPARAQGLVLVAPPTAWRTRPRQARVYRFSSGLIERFGLWPFRLLGSLPLLAVRGGPLAAMQRATLDQLEHADPRATVAALRGAAESDLPDPAALRRLAMPALVLAWAGDPVHPVSSAERLADLLPDVELRVAKSDDALLEWPDVVRAFVARTATPRPPAESPASSAPPPPPA